MEEDDSQQRWEQCRAEEIERRAARFTRSKQKALKEELAGPVSEERLREIIDTLLKTVDVYNDPYNPDLYWDEWTGEERECVCGHTYDRHFDGYDMNEHVGCKYCSCREFVEQPKMRIMPTPAKMYKYVGGQIEVQAGDDEGFPATQRGQIKALSFSDTVMTVECEYVCKVEKNKGFVPAENKPFVVDLMAVGASDIGQC